MKRIATHHASESFEACIAFVVLDNFRNYPKSSNCPNHGKVALLESDSSRSDEIPSLASKQRRYVAELVVRAVDRRQVLQLILAGSTKSLLPCEIAVSFDECPYSLSLSSIRVLSDRL